LAQTSKSCATWDFEKKKLVTSFPENKHRINESQSNIFFLEIWSLFCNYNFTFVQNLSVNLHLHFLVRSQMSFPLAGYDHN
jgi:hypothetical protein